MPRPEPAAPTLAQQLPGYHKQLYAYFAERNLAGGMSPERARAHAMAAAQHRAEVAKERLAPQADSYCPKGR